MASLRYLHQLMNERRTVRLTDGRVGKVVRVDTLFPANATIVTVWTTVNGPSISRVSLAEVEGEAEKQSA